MREWSDEEARYLSFLDDLDRSYRRGITSALTVVVVGLLLTATVAYGTWDRQEAAEDRRFEEAVADTTVAVEDRVAEYAEVLWGLRSYVEATDEIDRAGFEEYVETSAIPERLPATQAVGIATRTAISDVPALEAAMIAEGYAGYDVRTDGGASEVLPVTYLAPIVGNEGASGFDVAGDEGGRDAVDAAARSGQVTAGAPLVVGGTADAKALLLFLPLYDGGDLPDGEQERADAFAGIVLGLYRIDQLMDGVLGAEPDVELEIFDAGASSAETPRPADDRSLLYDSDGEVRGDEGPGAPEPNARVVLDLGNRRWTLFMTPGPGLPSSSPIEPAVVMVVGTLVSLLLGALVLEFTRSRKRAADLAQQMTEHLLEREQELREANEDVVRSNADLERYATIAAHDLQEPLRSILAYADLLQRKHEESLPPDVADYVTRMAQAAQRMRTLVTDLLAFARLEQPERRDERVDLNEIVEVALGDVSYLVRETGAVVDVDPLPVVRGSGRELIGVFANLLSNALKYRGDDPPLVKITATRRGDNWVVGVADNGSGIAPDYHDRIFELFRRLGPRDDNSGTGLGLAICQRTIARHGGRIWVESEEGEGAVFWFTLPVIADDEPGVRATVGA